MASTFEIRVPTVDQWDEVRRVDARAFGIVAEPMEGSRVADMFDLERFRIAVEGARIVGVAGSVALELTVPGGAHLATGGVTWVGVDTTRRRRGIARLLLDEVHRDSVERGEVVRALWASEASIYSRFGYGPATRRHDVVIDRRSLRGDEVVRHGTDPVVAFAEGQRRDLHLVEVWQHWARERCGEVSRPEGWWRRARQRWDRAEGDSPPAITMVCEGGYLVYRVVADWDAPPGSGRPGHRLDIVDFVATTPAARRALWNAITGVDLVAEISWRGLAPEDPLALWLPDARVMRTRGLVDALWLRVEDPTVALASRSYATRDTLVVGVGDSRFELDASPTGASCRALAATASVPTDVEIAPEALGAWLLGPLEPGRLMAAGRIRCRDVTIEQRVATLLAAPKAPHCSTLF